VLTERPLRPPSRCRSDPRHGGPLHPYLDHARRLVRSSTPVVVYDTETSGLIAIGDPFPWPWEIAACLVRKGLIEDRFHAILDWREPIPAGANLRGIDPATPMTTGIPPLEALTRFSRFVADLPLAGQRVELFDNVVMRAAYWKSDLPTPRGLREPGRSIDTRYLAELLYPVPGMPGAPADYHLGDLARHFGVPHDPAELHGAPADAEVTVGVLLGLVAEVERRQAARPSRKRSA
jgi:DNA polymerase III epsilon subunit-like protein